MNFGDRSFQRTSLKDATAVIRHGLVALRELEWIVERLDQLNQSHVLSPPRQHISAFHSTMARDKSLLTKFLQNVGDKRAAEMTCFGDFPSTGAFLLPVKVEQDQQTVIGLAAEKRQKSPSQVQFEIEPCHYHFYRLIRTGQVPFQGNVREFFHNLSKILSRLFLWNR
jgi:hypothetical protein